MVSPDSPVPGIATLVSGRLRLGGPVARLPHPGDLPGTEGWAMIPRNVVRVLIGAALLGITFLSVAALKLAMPSSGAADSRAEKHDAAPPASRETTLRGC